MPIGLWGVKGAIWGVLHGGGTIHGPDGGMLAGNNEFGVGLILILPLVYYQWHLVTNRHLRRCLMTMGLLVTLAVFFTYSRGALVGVCAMGAVLWLRSRAKISIGFLIIFLAVSTYSFAPKDWFQRMETIPAYEADGSAMSRIHLWTISLRIAELHPVTGGGFRVTYWPMITNNMLRGTDIPKLTIPRAAHSIYFDALSEHGWVGLALFLMIGGYSWFNCSWLIRRSRGRPDLAWANLLGRTGQPVLMGFAIAGAFQSLAYLDEYWCIIFIFDAARRLVARETASAAGAFSTALSMRPRVAAQGISPAMLVSADKPVGYAERNS